MVNDVESVLHQTGIDLRVVSVGTAHGLYPPDITPEVDFEQLEVIHRVSSVSLALHDWLRQHPDAELADLLWLMESAWQRKLIRKLWLST